MTDRPFEVRIPFLDPNEPEAELAALYVSEGERVSKGQVLCALETTKSTSEVAAEIDGYVVGLGFEAGQMVQAGVLLCYLADSPDWAPPAPAGSGPAPARSAEISKGLRITEPALTLAEERGFDLSRLPKGPLITRAILLEILGEPESAAVAERPIASFDPAAVVVYGGGGHGKSVIELLQALGTYRIVGVVDDGMETDQTVMGFPILGGARALQRLHRDGLRLAANAVGGIGNIRIRIEVFERLTRAGLACPSLVHPTAFVEPSAHLASGIQVFPHAYVGSEAGLGYGVIVNTGATVSHDCRLDDYANIAPGAMLAGGVRVGRGALIGMGATVNLEVRIGAGARIGNGATIKEDVPERGLVRAGTTWPG